MRLAEPGMAGYATAARRRVSVLAQFAAQVALDDDDPPAFEHGPMRLPCGCPLDADCDGYHPGALEGWPP